MMEVRHLGHTNFNEIMACLLEVFEGYFIKMPTNYEYYKKRWKAAKVNFEMSFGMFDNEKLVGFIIHAIDHRENDLIAFNTGTGVLPGYRGKRIVRTIYDVATAELLKNGISKSVLEVIVENERALKAYSNVGFKIRKKFKSYGGKLLVKEASIELKEVNFNDITWSEMPNQNSYSWDFNSRSLQRGNSQYYQIIFNDKVESYFSFNQENNTVNQLEVLVREKGNWERLFSAIQSVSKSIRIINVDSRLIEKINAIEEHGLHNTVNQYEMELNL